MKIAIDFAPRPRRRAPLRLGLGAGLLAALIGGLGTLSPESVATLSPPPAAALSGTEVAAVNRAIADLNFPWPALLAALEAAAGDSVRFSQFEADAAGNLFSLQGEARNEAAVLALPAALRGQGPIGEARLLGQSRALPGEGSEFPVRFSLVLTRQSAGESP